MDEKSLEADFRVGFGPFWGEGPPEATLAFADEDVWVIQDDTPFVLEKIGLLDQLDFNTSGIWERFTWKPRNLDFRCFGSTGVVSGCFSLHGKPVDAGYRQRDGMFSIVCYYDEDNKVWRMLKGHFNPIVGCVVNGSPA